MLIWITGCEATSVQVVPTIRPTATPTSTTTPTSTPDPNATPTATPTLVQISAETGGPTPTPLLGPTRTPDLENITPTINPNAPRIEFFTSDEIAVAPGSAVDLFWSSRRAENAIIYQLNRAGERTRLWNVAPDGTLTVQTRQSDRGQVDFLLVVSDDNDVEVQQSLSIALACPVSWFFAPPPEDCPDDEGQDTFLIEQQFERGRMVYVQTTDLIYVLFNDGLSPAWASFQNRYDPAIHDEIDENFPFLQPVARLGFLWRGNDTVRTRLGSAVETEVAFDGVIQTAGDASYITSSNRTILQLLPNGDSWQIITLP